MVPVVADTTRTTWPTWSLRYTLLEASTAVPLTRLKLALVAGPVTSPELVVARYTPAYVVRTPNILDAIHIVEPG